MKLTHYNDGEQKQLSHEVSLKDNLFYNQEVEVYSHNILDTIGYGETKEEALEDFKKKIDWLMKEYKAFESMLFETDTLTDNIIEVNCLGEQIYREREK